MLAQPPSLSVSLVTFFSDVDQLRGALQSLQQAAVAAGVEPEVTVVDHSADSAYAKQVEALLAELLPTAKLICAPDNKGYGAGHNRALYYADSEFHLVLNPDVELAPDALHAGLQFLQAHPAVVLAAPRVYGSSGDIEYLCKRYPSLWVLFLRAFAPQWLRQRFAGRLANYEMRDLCSGSQPCPVPLASGCFMLLRTPAMAAVGGFSDDYFMYFEDYDLCLRLAEQGQLMFVPAMEIVHHGGRAAHKGGGHLGMFARSARTFFGQHGWQWF